MSFHKNCQESKQNIKNSNLRQPIYAKQFAIFIQELRGRLKSEQQMPTMHVYLSSTYTYII